MEAPDRVLSVNGIDVAIDDRGDPLADAVPLVLVHGFTGGRVDFADVIDTLAEDRRVVAWDHRGHADSTNTGDAATYTFDQLADDMAGVLDQLDIDSFHLLGHSMGGVVAQRYTLAHLDQVRSLILMDTAGEAMRGIPAEIIDVTVATGRSEGMAAVASTVHPLLAAAPLPEASRDRILERLVHKLSHMDVEAFDALGRELGVYPSMLGRLGSEVTVPVTVIVGADDVGLRPAADALHTAIRQSELVVIPDVAHSPQDENPSAWLTAVRAHLARS